MGRNRLRDWIGGSGKNREKSSAAEVSAYHNFRDKKGHNLWKTIWAFLKKLSIELPYFPAVSRLGMYPKELKAETQDICTPMFMGGIIHNSQKVETT